jgi:hypothetical protein
MDRIRARSAKPKDRRLIVDGSNRPRDVCDLGQTVVMAGLPLAPSGPIATLDDANRTKPGELMRLVAEGLTASGFDVRPPEYEGGCRLSIGCQGARCAVSVSDWGDVEWEYCPWANDEVDPKQIADVATVLLTGRAQDYPRRGHGYSREGITFKGIVGLELKARGFDVELAVYEDEDYFDARAEIVVTRPKPGDDAAVHVADDGSVTWTRDYWAEAAIVVWEPDFYGWIADPEKVAGAVVATITRAMSQAAPARR